MTTGNENPTSTFDDTVKAWSEQTLAWQRQMREYQDNALASLAQCRQLYADGLKRYAESSDRPGVSANWAQVAQSVDSAYDFAVELINQQRAFVKSLVEAAASGKEK